MPDNFPGTASLVNDVDKKILVVLRDGRKLVGFLRSFDQFANLVLHETIERIYIGNEYGDIPRGILIIRGENVVLIGELDPVKEANCPLVEVDINDVLDRQREEQERRDEANKLKNKILLERGYSLPTDPLFDDLYG